MKMQLDQRLVLWTGANASRADAGGGDGDTEVGADAQEVRTSAATVNNLLKR